MNKENTNVLVSNNGRKTMKTNTNEMEQFVNSRIVQL